MLIFIYPFMITIMHAVCLINFYVLFFMVCAIDDISYRSMICIIFKVTTRKGKYSNMTQRYQWCMTAFELLIFLWIQTASVSTCHHGLSICTCFCVMMLFVLEKWRNVNALQEIKHRKNKICIFFVPTIFQFGF